MVGLSLDGGVQEGPNVPWLDAGQPPIAPPQLTPCPDGWTDVVGDDITTCDPYPSGGVLDCPAGQAHFPGEAGCGPVGAPCPASGEFADGLPVDTRIVYVQPGATGGDGAGPSSPFGSLSEFSITALPRGSVIALARGTHVGPIRLVRGVVLWGACTADAVVTTSVSSESDGVVAIRDDRAELRDLTVSDALRPGLWVSGARAEVELEGVVVARTEAVGVWLSDSARLTVGSAVVRDTRPRARDRTRGRGLALESGAVADLSRVVISGNRDFGVFADGEGSTLTVTGVVVRDTASRESDGSFGSGIGAQRGATASLTDTLVAGSDHTGVFVSSTNTMLSSVDVLVRGTASGADADQSSRGFLVQTGATASVTRALLSENTGHGLAVVAETTSVVVSDVVVRDGLASPVDGMLGRGIQAQEGATLQVERALVFNNREVGIFAAEAGTRLTLADGIIRDTRSRDSDGLVGDGLNIVSGARAELSRVLVERNAQVGLFAVGGGSRLTAVDIAIRDTQGQEGDGARGRGLSVESGAVAELSGALIDGNRDVGVYVSNAGAALSLTDVVVRDTQADRRDETGGRGMGVQRGAGVTATRVLLEQSRELGIFVDGVGSTAALLGTVVRDTRVRECSTTTCRESPIGHGVGVYEGAAVSMSTFAVSDSDSCGLHLARDGQLDLVDGEVSGHAIGVCLQTDGYDIGRLMNGVQFRDNGVNLEATSLPIPAATAPMPPP